MAWGVDLTDVNEEQVAGLRRLDDAEERLHAARRRRGITDAELARRLGVDEDDVWDVAAGSDLYLFALARHVAAAGGRLELRAVFDDEEVLLLCEPPAGRSGAR